jgi:hypothetical protein
MWSLSTNALDIKYYTIILYNNNIYTWKYYSILIGRALQFYRNTCRSGKEIQSQEKKYMASAYKQVLTSGSWKHSLSRHDCLQSERKSLYYIFVWDYVNLCTVAVIAITVFSDRLRQGFVHGEVHVVQHQTNVFYFVSLKFSGLPDLHILTDYVENLY